MTIAQPPEFITTNTHFLVQNFDYVEPATLDEAISLLKRYGKQAQLMLGGTHLLTMMKMEREKPGAIISLKQIPGLNTITKTEDGGLCVGAGMTIFEIRSHPYIRTHYRSLAEACAAFGSTQIQIMGTLGGNLCNGSPASDTVPALLVFGAHIVLNGSDGKRQIPLEEFLLGPGKVALKDGEILTSIILPPPSGTSLFIKISRVAADLAKANLAIWLIKKGDQIINCRLALGSVSPTVIRIKRAESFLSGKNFTPQLLEEAAKIVSEDIAPIDDIRSKSWYRRELAKAMTIDALNEVWKRYEQKIEDKPVSLISPRLETKTHHIVADERREVELIINGQKYCVNVKSKDLLLNVLREQLELYGAKYGCGLGECGACTVLMDGKAVLACLVLAVAAEGHEIMTVEGLRRSDGTLDPLQDIFVEEAAFQCGYCTPGFLMATKSLINEIPHPDEERIREYLRGNRCRCTGYLSIMRAVVRSVENYSKTSDR